MSCFRRFWRRKREAEAAGKGFGSIRNPIGMMEQEHDWEAERLEKMREIARDYQLPEKRTRNCVCCSGNWKRWRRPCMPTRAWKAAFSSRARWPRKDARSKQAA